MSRFLVTGGCGFIGSHLVDTLVRDGAQVVVLDDLSTGTTDHLPAEAVFIRGSVTDRSAVLQAVEGVDGCFHLAAIASVQRSAEDYIGTHRVNLGGNLMLLDALHARGAAAAFVYASSAAVYGDCPVSPIAEDSPKQPQSGYGADKLAGELHAWVAAQTFGMATAGLRFFNVYGPRQPPGSPYSGVVSIFADRLARREPITVFGDGQQTRDLVHVADVVRALRRAMERQLPGGPVFNVCTGRAISVLDLAAVIGGLLRVTPEVRFGPPRIGEIRHSVGDPSAAQVTLGLGESLELEVGLRELLGV